MLDRINATESCSYTEVKDLVSVIGDLDVSLLLISLLLYCGGKSGGGESAPRKSRGGFSKKTVEKAVEKWKAVERGGAKRAEILRRRRSFAHERGEPARGGQSGLAVSYTHLFETSIDFLIGHTDINHRIEPTDRFDLNDEEARFLTAFRSLSRERRSALLALIESMLS